MLRTLTSLVVALGLQLPALAQTVPYAQTVVSVSANLASSEGLWFFDRATGTSTPITGLVAAGSLGSGVNAVRMDPIDDRIWLGGINNNGNTANQLNWVRLTGSTVTQFQQFATIAPTSAQAINSIVFDDNSNPIFCAGTAAVGGGVFRADRATGGPATLLGAVASGTHNALTVDGSGNVYVGMFGNGQIHQLLKNPDGSFQPPAPWGTVSNPNIFSLTFAPSDGVNPDQIFVACGGPASPLVSVVPVPTGGAGVAVTTTQTILNWIDYDRRNNDLLVVQTSPDRMIQLARTGGDTVLAALGSSNIGTPTACDSNDAGEGVIVAAPMILNGGIGPFDLELGATAAPGSLVLLAVVVPFVHIFGFGTAGVDGRVSVKIPGLTMSSPLPPASVQFVAVWFDPASNFLIGPLLSWPTL